MPKISHEDYYSYDTDDNQQARSRYIRGGITFGATIAIAISWSINKSILWAVLHGLCGWLYVIYYAVVR